MKKLLYTTLIMAVAGILISSAVTRSPKKEISENLKVFNALFKELQTFYVDSIDAKKSIHTAIDAMLADIDPYTEYITEKEMSDFMSIHTGEYAGVGSYIMRRDGNVYFSEPSEGSPAQIAGIRAGDMIVMIDNDSTLGWETDKVSSTLKGPAGTKVKVTVKRPYVEDSILVFDITRRKIQMPTVPYYGVVDGNMGYICLTSFNDNSPREVRNALIDLKDNYGVAGVILDLRGNGGGVLESAVNIIGLFVPKNTKVLDTRGRDALQEKEYKTSAQPIAPKMPLVVLIDGASASASEIVAGALQDLDRAVIVGTRSFGKGLVQTTRDLPGGEMLKVTIAKYYIPSGRLIQAIDYSHRNADGSVSRIADSLTNVFRTRAGREVRDGGGITPDTIINFPEYPNILYPLVSDNWIFDYATRYAATHDTIAPPAEFVVTDDMYEDFKASINPDKINYDKRSESLLTLMREVVEKEGYMTDSVSCTLDRLEGMLKHDLMHDLDINREKIEPFIASDLMTRYYYARGKNQQALRYDNMLPVAIEILRDSDRYNSMLSPKKTAKK